MSGPLRCPACGATNAATASWCGQCLARFGDSSQTDPEAAPVEFRDANEDASPVAPVSLAASGEVGAAIRRAGDDLIWTCPGCATENPIDATACPVCSTPMARLFGAKPRPALRRIGPTAVSLSAALPGAGHLWAGRTGDGVARIVLFAWTAIVGVFLLMRSGRSAGVFHAIGAVFAIVAVAVWIVTFLEAQRLAKGESATIVPGKVLLWGTAALTLVLFLGLAAGARTTR